MSSISLTSHRTIRFETSIEIARAHEDVFDYAADAGRLADWNAAVTTVEPLPGSAGHHTMRRELPTGVAINEIAIAARRPDELTLRTLTGPTPLVYRYTFAPTATGTRITLRAEVELGGSARLAGPLATQGLRRGVDANLSSLRNILESS
jgi:uncharacterized protein YndB with AHSA1/START domain